MFQLLKYTPPHIILKFIHYYSIRVVRKSPDANNSSKNMMLKKQQQLIDFGSTNFAISLLIVTQEINLA